MLDSIRLCWGELKGVGDTDRGVKPEELAGGYVSESSEDSSPMKNLGELVEARKLLRPTLLDIEDR